MAVMDWATRGVQSFRLLDTRDTRLCTDTLTGTLKRVGRPEILNTDQGSQFTSLEFTSVVKDPGGAISVGRTGRCIDNIFTERLWCLLKYEAVFVHEFSDGFQFIGGDFPMSGASNLPAPSLALGTFHPFRGLRSWTGRCDSKEPRPLYRLWPASTGTRRCVRRNHVRMTYDPKCILNLWLSCLTIRDYVTSTVERRTANVRRSQL